MAKVRKTINAVHEDDLINFLESVALKDDFENGLTKCKFCKRTVNIDNIYSVIKDSGTYKLVSNDAECVSALMEYLEVQRIKKAEID